MNYIAFNLVPILAATFVGLLIGAAYRAAFIRTTAQGSRPYAAVFLIVAFIAEFWLAAILAGALIVAPVQVGPWTVALGSAIVIWVGFVVPTLVVSYLARGLGPLVLALDCAHWLVVMVSQGAVLNTIGLVKP